MRKVLVLAVLLAGCGDSTGPEPDVSYEMTALAAPVVLGQVYATPGNEQCEGRRRAIEGGDLTLRADGTYTMRIEMWESHGATGAAGFYWCLSADPRDIGWTWNGTWTRSGSSAVLTVFGTDPVGTIELPGSGWPQAVVLDGSARGWGSTAPYSGLSATTWARVD